MHRCPGQREEDPGDHSTGGADRRGEAGQTGSGHQGETAVPHTHLPLGSQVLYMSAHLYNNINVHMYSQLALTNLSETRNFVALSAVRQLLNYIYILVSDVIAKNF